MRKVIHKWFWVWDFDKEEKWLNEMAAKGLALVAVGWCRYEFEDSVPGEYQICLDFLDSRCNGVENEKYITFLEETKRNKWGQCRAGYISVKKRRERLFSYFRTMRPVSVI